VGRRAQLFELLASEDVDTSQVDFGVAVLTSLGGAHIDDLARAAFDDNVTAQQNDWVNSYSKRNGRVSLAPEKAKAVGPYPFLRRAEHCIGKVADAPAEACSKVWLLCYT
jgi:hypothetical protein